MSNQATLIFLSIIFFPVAFGFLLLTNQETKERLIWALIISIGVAALIVGGTGDSYVEPY